MNITCTRTLIGCVLLTALGCAAESSKSEANDEPMPNDAAMIDGMEPTDSPVDLGRIENDASEANDRDMNLTDEVDGQTDNVDGGEIVVTECQEFEETHLYRQSAERFADYEIRSMCDFAGELVLIVNTASQCGFTGQYEGLMNLENRFGSQGLRLLGFLSNDFGNQAGTTDEVQMCNDRFQVTFEQFTPVGVKSNSSSGQHPIFEWLTNQPGMEGEVTWNFGKFLVGGDGTLIARWGSTVEPEDPQIVSAIEQALANPRGVQ